uniref:EGF-like domain-containing protein n=1 Tax=Chromera velia CCMP2878 TaxID=1169474 RepID=A0A0G4IC14_9ALVE|eukprot:Cvel_2249.t1-p1 / transcript=Cvel_2249.t1 / gene=Cvel_2249 / organism=Chromera_velia_CCMP2878 / gene_product=Fibrillin-1, putative / transcript_product=Fibrillin-1, putative / location=Cvel_scaffold86:131121-145573(+) / protein_length=2624 / sequence_SO=supercontig / SO=protein_coding / is_pseudo=false
MPCAMLLNSWSLTTMTFNARTRENVDIHGSNDGSSWTLLGSYNDELDWAVPETREFGTVTDATFSWIRLTVKRIVNTGDDFMSFAELGLFTTNLTDLCSNGENNCDPNAMCLNSAPSFTCSCNAGYTGDGVACALIPSIPPTDIGQARTWMRDINNTYNGLITFYKDHTDFCNGGHNCNTNAACQNSNASFTCTCNQGYAGDGISCFTVHQFPPTDIGAADGWTKDFYNVQNGHPTIYKDHSGGVCPGKYRVSTSQAWLTDLDGIREGTITEYPPSGAFDAVTAGGYPNYVMWLSRHKLPGRGGATPLNEMEATLHLPCVINLTEWAVKSRDNQLQQSPYKMSAYASQDGDQWHHVGSFDGQGGWGNIERRAWPLQDVTGSVSFFKVIVHEVENAEIYMSGVHDVEVWGIDPKDPCAGHSCPSGTTCAAAGPNHICAPPQSVKGRQRFPPINVGRANTWTKDYSVMYEGLPTIYKDVGGLVCPGRYRVKTNTAWLEKGTNSTWNSGEYGPNGAFDGVWSCCTDAEHTGWHTDASDIPGSSNPDTNIELILELPCFITNLTEWAVISRPVFNSRHMTPYKMSAYGSHNGGQNWTLVGERSAETGWIDAERRAFEPTGARGPFSSFKLIVHRIDHTAPSWMALSEVELYGSNWTELDECATGVHNCARHATCSNTNGSFTCACNSPYPDGDGIACGISIPPADIGRGDDTHFTWTKDTNNLFNGIVTIYKDYQGEVCPGQYRTYAPNSWMNNAGVTTAMPGHEHLPSSLFDASLHGNPWASAGFFNGQDSYPAEADEQIILGLPCYVRMEGYQWFARIHTPNQNPLDLTVSGANSSYGPWTELGRYDNVTDWKVLDVKTWAVDADPSVGPFNLLRITVRRIQNPTAHYASGLANFLVGSWTELDECAAGVHNCDPQAICANTNGSFTCTCTSGLDGDGVACGFRVPPADIGRGDSANFMWTKDTSNLYNGLVTIFKDYGGELCPGEYRVFAPNGWLNNPGLSASVGSGEWLPSSAFDGSEIEPPYHSAAQISGLSDPTDANVQLILGVPCYITLAGYAIQARDWGSTEDQNPGSTEVAGSNSSNGPWTTLHSFTNVTDWVQAVEKKWAVDTRVGPFKYFRFLVKRIANSVTGWLAVTQAHLLAATLTELDECATGIHNCDPQATCTNTNGSFTCACPNGLEGGGTICGKRIPPADIGRGDSANFTWTKDAANLFNGVVTIYKEYNGEICPGQYCVYAPNSWLHNPGVTTTVTGHEWLPSSAFDGSAEEPPFHPGTQVAGTSDPNESNSQLILQTPCYIILAGYAFQARDSVNTEGNNPSSMNVSGANSTNGPWTTLHSFSNVTDWVQAVEKKWAVDTRVGPFNYFRFLVKRISSSVTGWLAMTQAHLYAVSVAEVDECAAGVHNCDPQATCTNTNGSFTCASNGGLFGDGIACGVRIPPTDIGAGHSDDFTWSKDTTNLFGGFVTIFKQYVGDVCPGEYRVYTSEDWDKNPGLATSVATNENLPSALFNGTGSGLPWKTASNLIPGLDEAIEADVQIILETPCHFSLAGYGWMAHEECCEIRNPSALTLAGANSTAGPWTTLHSYDNVSDWVVNATKVFRADAATTGEKFNFFRFTVRRISKSGGPIWASGDDAFLLASVVAPDVDECSLVGAHNCDGNATCTNTNGSFVCACNDEFLGNGISGNCTHTGVVQIPPSDIGSANTWTKDPSTTYNGIYTIYRDYTGPLCPGRYRAMSNTAWVGDPGTGSFGSSEYPVNGAFDRSTGTINGISGVAFNSVLNSGTAQSADATVSVILQAPCSIALTRFGVESQDHAGGAAEETASKVKVYGGNDMNVWTELGSFAGETSWAAGERKKFEADETKGPFTHFKFELQKRSQSADGPINAGELELFAQSWHNPCNPHPCHSNATCRINGTAPACTCSPGFYGDGTTCLAYVKLLPADIGRGDTWTKDTGVTYGGTYTLTKAYSGSVCSGLFRAKSNRVWSDDGGSSTFASLEFPVSGAFDRVAAVTNQKSGWGIDSPVAGTSAGSDDDVEAIIEMPCKILMGSFGVEAHTSCCQENAPSKMDVFGRDGNSSWEHIGAFENVNYWSVGEMKYFSANATAGPFSAFKFLVRRIAKGADDKLVVEDIALFASQISGYPCLDGTHNCNASATCTDTASSFECACNVGYFGDGVTACADVNECIGGKHNCLPEAVCSNTEGSFTCAVSVGFSGDGIGTASNIDECSTNVDNCYANATCTDTYGSFLCSCLIGLGGDGVSLCSNLCASAGCADDATCAVTGSTANCTCNNGFIGDGAECYDTLECGESDNCHSKATCTDGSGSFSCACILGYSGDGVSCSDVNECGISDNCDSNAKCSNSAGSFSCQCNSGFDGSGTSCLDVDECAAQSHSCVGEAICKNTQGSFTCTCRSGFQGDGTTSCADVDECANNPCHAQASCTNSVGDYSCACAAPYKGDGFTCLIETSGCNTAAPVLIAVDSVCEGTGGNDTHSLGTQADLSAVLDAAFSSPECSGKFLYTAVPSGPSFTAACHNEDDCVWSASAGARTLTASSSLQGTGRRVTHSAGVLSNGTQEVTMFFTCDEGFTFDGSEASSTTVQRTATCMTLGGEALFQLRGPSCFASRPHGMG